MAIQPTQPGQIPQAQLAQPPRTPGPEATEQNAPVRRQAAPNRPADEDEQMRTGNTEPAPGPQVRAQRNITQTGRPAQPYGNQIDTFA